MQKQAEYEEAIRTKYPEQVVIAIAKDKNGKANPVTLGWTMIASGSPPMMAIAVAKTHYSIETIRHSKCFTIAFPSSEMADAALFFGSRSAEISTNWRIAIARPRLPRRLIRFYFPTQWQTLSACSNLKPSPATI